MKTTALRTAALSTESLLRLFADLIMVAFAYGAALMLRFVVVFLSDDTTGRGLLSLYAETYSRSVWLLLGLSAVIFGLSGFYTRGRVYMGRYKFLIVLQAVAVVYLAFGFAGFLLPERVNPPRSVIFIAAGLSLLTLLTSRLWSHVWRGADKTAKPAETNNQKRVAVIGGAGYIGSALLPRLLERGYEVTLLDLLMFGEEPIRDVIRHPNLKVIRADFRQVDRVVEAVRGAHTVIHLGGLVGDPACAVDENLTLEINLMATKMIAEVSKGLGVSRFVFASTCSVYGASDLVLDERSMLNPVSLYARSKIAGEQVLHKLQDDQFSVTILRFGTIYGLSGRTRFDLVVNLLAAKSLLEGKITVFGGDQWRPFVHVKDAALSVQLAVEAPRERVHNQTFNVGSNEQNMTLGQVGELIHGLVPQAELIDSGRDGDRRNYRVDFSRIRNALGFRPQFTVKAGVEQVLDAIRNGQVSDYRKPIYSNVKFLTEETSSEIVRQYYSGWERDMILKTVPAAPTAEAQPTAVAMAHD